MEKTKAFYKNPKVDYLMFFFNLDIVPTKQDKFSKIDVIYSDESNIEFPLENIYYRKNEKDSVISLDSLIKNYFVENKVEKIEKPKQVEVFLSISTKTKKRFEEVDVDNLAKCVLDCLNGVAFEDDSQVTRLLCNKYIDKLQYNSITIGITELSETRSGLTGDIKILSDVPWE